MFDDTVVVEDEVNEGGVFVGRKVIQNYNALGVREATPPPQNWELCTHTTITVSRAVPGGNPKIERGALTRHRWTKSSYFSCPMLPGVRA